MTNKRKVEWLINKVILTGRLTRDPDIRHTQGENPMCIANYTLAVDRRFKRDNEPTADFIRCVAFGKAAEFLDKYCHQGTKLIVEGRIQTGSYTDKDGNKRYTTYVYVEQMEFAESKRVADENTTPTQKQTTDTGEFMNIPDGVENELPFN